MTIRNPLYVEISPFEFVLVHRKVGEELMMKPFYSYWANIVKVSVLEKSYDLGT